MLRAEKCSFKLTSASVYKLTEQYANQPIFGWYASFFNMLYTSNIVVQCSETEDGAYITAQCKC